MKHGVVFRMLPSSTAGSNKELHLLYLAQAERSRAPKTVRSPFSSSFLFSEKPLRFSGGPSPRLKKARGVLYT